MMSLLALVCGTMFAQTTVTFDAKNDKSESAEVGDNVSISKNGVTITVSQGILGNGKEYRCYKGQTMTIESASGEITNVKLTATASGTAKYGPGNFTATNGGEYTFEDKTGTWTGNASSVVLTASEAQVRMTSIEVIVANGGGVTKQEAGLAFSETEVSVEKGAAFTAPTFSKATTAAVTFASDNEAVATVNNEGVISLGGELGKAVITASSEANDEYYAGKATCTIEVFSYNTYKKATELKSGNAYLLVAYNNDSTYYAYPLDESKKYGYLYCGEAEGQLDEIKVKSSYNDTFTFTTEGTGYSIADPYGRYLTQSGEYKSFQLSDTPAAWNVEPQADGTYKIEMNGYYIQFSGNYDSFGVYTDEQAESSLPMLFEIVDPQAGINGVETEDGNNANAPMYNLAGQRVNKSFKGIVIQNGKKFVNNK